MDTQRHERWLMDGDGFNAYGGIYNICFVQKMLAVIQQVYGSRKQVGKKRSGYFYGNPIRDIAVA